MSSMGLIIPYELAFHSSGIGGYHLKSKPSVTGSRAVRSASLPATRKSEISNFRFEICKAIA